MRTGFPLGGYRQKAEHAARFGRRFGVACAFLYVHAARHYPGAAAGRSPRSSHPAVSAFPGRSPGRPAHRPFRGLLGVHSRCGLHTRAVTVIRDPLSEGFRHFVASMPAPVASGWSGRRVGLAPTGKRRLVTAHTQSGRCGRAWSDRLSSDQELLKPALQPGIRAAERPPAMLKPATVTLSLRWHKSRRGAYTYRPTPERADREEDMERLRKSFP